MIEDDNGTRSTRRGSRELVGIVLLAASLLAAACGGSDDEATSDTTTSPSTVEDEPTTSTASTGDATTTTGAPEALTASYRGVTPETIKVGVMTFDWDRLSEIGVNLGRSSSEDIYVAALEAINERGGVNGRMLELYPVSYLPVGTDEADAACVELTQDHEVFVVTGTTLDDEILCITDVHETAAVVASGMTAQRKAAAKAPYAIAANEVEERSEAFVAAMEAQGLLDGATIGVGGSVDVSEDAFNATMTAFEEAGYAPLNGLTGNNDDDLVASAQDADVVYERFRAEGVNTVASTTGVPLEIGNAVNAGFEADQWMLLIPMTGRGLRDAGVDPAVLDGAFGVSPTPVGTSLQPAMADDPVIAACVDDIEARTGRTIPYELDVEVNDIAAALTACSISAILEEGLTNAGTDLTNDSFREGLEAIGEIELPGRPGASLGPGDLSASSPFTTVRFNAATQAWEPVE